MTRSEAIFEMAREVIPGGVNSPVRAFGSIGTNPPFIRKADKSRMWDEDGKEYIDFIGSWGPMILGHNNDIVREAVIKACADGLSFGAATALEVEMASLITAIVPSVEMVRMVNSGTEAVMSAIRVARGFTRRDKIIKFVGCYHGHADYLLVKAGSGALTQGQPDSLGVPQGCTKDVLTATYNDLNSVEDHFKAFPDDIAAIIVEPVAANMGVVLPEKGFLEGLRELCDKYGALLIFDEVITGFRLGIDGAQGYYGVRPDLTTYGKIIGAGMPVGAYGGRKDVMSVVSPLGGVYQAGTLSGNPVAMTAGITQLSILRDHPSYYEKLNQKSDIFFTSLKEVIKESGLNLTLNHVGSIGSIFFTDQPVVDYDSAKTSDTAAFARYARYMLGNGIYLAPAQFEAMFISMVHTDDELAYTLAMAKNALASLK
ncbi:MAG: glutamate-1-semialdehyde 2,1-aminomutase [Lachnospiraceae bacterium]|nr:glutamate-1-semialdehyde 2,1-aminomutase [Lachnospiraceae bacterium]